MRSRESASLLGAVGGGGAGGHADGRRLGLPVGRPSLVALVGWIFVFATTPPRVIAFGLGALVLGVLCFGAWSWTGRTWPFESRRVAAG